MRAALATFGSHQLRWNPGRVIKCVLDWQTLWAPALQAEPVIQKPIYNSSASSFQPAPFRNPSQTWLAV